MTRYKKTHIFQTAMLMCMVVMGLALSTVTTSCNRSDNIEYDSDTLVDGRDKRFLYSFFLKENEDIDKPSWADGQAVGAFLTEEFMGLGNAYRNDPAQYNNLYHMYVAGVWQSTPPAIRLYDSNAVIYAYYPFVPDVNPKAVAMSVKAQTDYMYGTHQAPQTAVCEGKNVAYIQMKHAMSMLDFRFRKEDFKKDVVISAVMLNKVHRTDRDDKYDQLPLAATLDIATGNVTQTEWGQIRFDGFEYLLTDDFNDKNRLLRYVFPYDIIYDEIELTLCINGEYYTTTLDWQNDWNRGFRCVYNIVFTGRNIYIDSVEIKPWKNVDIDVTIRD